MGTAPGRGERYPQPVQAWVVARGIVKCSVCGVHARYPEGRGVQETECCLTMAGMCVWS